MGVGERLHILFEHASQSTPLLPFRMHKYSVSIMDKHLITNETDELPLIYPIILYTGKRPCTHSMDLFDLFSPQDKELAKKIFTAPYHLIDLAKTPDEELEKFFWYGTMARTLKHIHDSDILPFFEKAFDILKELEKLGENRYIESTVFYLAEFGNAPRKEELMNRMKKLKSINEEKLMTLVDHFKADLLKRGIAKGIEQGREEKEAALKKAKQEMAKILLSKGIDIEIISETTGLSKEEIRKFYS